jgi:hypothetical protein
MQASDLVVNLSNVQEVKTEVLVAFYNVSNPESPVKRFRDRKTAEARVMAILEKDRELPRPLQFTAESDRLRDMEVLFGITPLETAQAALAATIARNEKAGLVADKENAANVRAFAFGDSSEVAENPNKAAFIFPKAIDFIDAVTPKLPPVMENAEKWIIDAKPEVDIFSLVKVDNVETNPIYRVFYRTEVDGVEEDITIFEGDKEGAATAYQNATAHYPTNNAFKLFFKNGDNVIWNDSFEASEEESEEEAAARIEAEAAAEASAGSEKGAAKAERKQSGGRGSNSLGVAISWQDKEVRAARLTRDGVTVTVDGVTTEHQSTRAAFREYRLPDSVHIRFRLKLKASRDEVFNFNGVDYRFKMVEINID